MKKLNSLSFKMPLSISCISSIIIIILLVISLFFSSKGITESINVGFRNTVEGYAYLLDALNSLEDLKVETEDSDYGAYIISISDLEQGDNYYWNYYVNGEYASVGVSSYEIKNNDVFTFKLEKFE